MEKFLKKYFRIIKRVLLLDINYIYNFIFLRINKLQANPVKLIDSTRGYYHSASGGLELKKVLRTLNVSQSMCLEMGVGMGIAAITLSNYFVKVIGVDISPELLIIANQNFNKMKIKNFELHLSDAKDYQVPKDITYCYMYDPFPVVVMQSFLSNLMVSLAKFPRPFTIIYKNPSTNYECNLAIIDSGFKETACFNFTNQHPIFIYKLIS